MSLHPSTIPVLIWMLIFVIAGVRVGLDHKDAGFKGDGKL